MRNDHACPAHHNPVQGSLDHWLTGGIKSTGGLIQQQDLMLDEMEQNVALYIDIRIQQQDLMLE
jgi:hypothetical protein